MSIASELQRILDAKTAIQKALINQGYNIPSGSSMDSWAPVIDPTFAGLHLSAGPVMYLSGSVVLQDHWNYETYKVKYGAGGTSTFLSYLEVGQIFDSEGSSFNVDSGEIDNANTIDGWRVPSLDEWLNICSVDSSVRPGATVNGSPNKHYAQIVVSVARRYVETTVDVHGILLFPDNLEISGVALSSFDVSDNTNTVVAESDLNAYLGQGCAFLPCFGQRSDFIMSSWSGFGTSGEYWSTKVHPSVNEGASGLNFSNNNSPHSYDSYRKDPFYLSVRLVK